MHEDMADNLEDRDAIVAGPPTSNISNASSALTDLAAGSLSGNPAISAGSSVLSRDFVNTGMDVVDNEQSRDNKDRDSAAKVQNEAAEGSTDTDADAASSTIEDTSTVESHEEDGGGAINSSMQMDNSDTGEQEPPHSYNARIRARRNILQDSIPSYNTSQKYHFSSIYNIPQQTVQTHTIALPPCSSHLFTGGSDGYIRRYAWYASLRNYSSEKHPVLKGYWENLSITAIQARALLWNQSMQDDPTRIRFGPAGISGGTTMPVHNLAVQRDELYCLAGSAEGVINLYSVRLDEGQCRACLGITGKAHKRNTPVSALALSEGDASLLSGGWDKQILVRCEKQSCLCLCH
jgi:transcriptional activator SPT8